MRLSKGVKRYTKSKQVEGASKVVLYLAIEWTTAAKSVIITASSLAIEGITIVVEEPQNKTVYIHNNISGVLFMILLT